MRVKTLITAACLCLALGLCGSTVLAQNAIKTPIDSSVVGKLKKPPRIHLLPDLTITRIYHKQHMGREGIWADIKNMGGEIPQDQFNRADMRFYLTYIDQKLPTASHVRRKVDNGYALNYIDRAGVLRKPGGTISVVAPGNMTCNGVVKVKVQVDLPISGKGRIKESNEKNNEKRATLFAADP